MLSQREDRYPTEPEACSDTTFFVDILCEDGVFGYCACENALPLAFMGSDPVINADDKMVTLALVAQLSSGTTSPANSGAYDLLVGLYVFTSEDYADNEVFEKSNAVIDTDPEFAAVRDAVEDARFLCPYVQRTAITKIFLNDDVQKDTFDAIRNSKVQAIKDYTPRTVKGAIYYKNVMLPWIKRLNDLTCFGYCLSASTELLSSIRTRPEAGASIAACAS